MKRKMIFLTLFSLLVLSSCEMNNTPNNPTGETTYYGETRMLGQGTIRSWVKLDDATSNPTSIGVTVSESALSGLPTTGDQDLSLQFPSQANKTVFKSFTLVWHSQGHPPVGVYDKPHFDFAFFTITPSQSQEIPGTLADSMNAYMSPQQGYIANNYYILPGSYEAGVGGVAADTSGSEFRGVPFTAAVVYGYYQGKITVIAPMITLAFLQSKATLNENINLPQNFSMTGYYPTKLSVTYDATAKEYNIALTNMVYHMATQ